MSNDTNVIRGTIIKNTDGSISVCPETGVTFVYSRKRSTKICELLGINHLFKSSLTYNSSTSFEIPESKWDSLHRSGQL